MTTADIIEAIHQAGPECLLADGFDEALIGIVEGAGRPTVACYDYDRCVEILMQRGMSQEDAVEHLEFNTIGAYVGEYTPMFVHDWRDEVQFQPDYPAAAHDAGIDPPKLVDRTPAAGCPACLERRRHLPVELGEYHPLAGCGSATGPKTVQNPVQKTVQNCPTTPHK